MEDIPPIEFHYEKPKRLGFFESLFALFMALIGFTLIFSGYGTIFGLPIVCGCVKYFSNKI